MDSNFAGPANKTLLSKPVLLLLGGLMSGASNVVTMSSKGQVVVPRAIRDAVQADAGTEFIVYGKGDTIVLKKIRLPKFSQKELEQLVERAEEKLQAAGFVTEDDVRDLVQEAVQKTRHR